MITLRPDHVWKTCENFTDGKHRDDGCCALCDRPQKQGDMIYIAQLDAKGCGPCVCASCAARFFELGRRLAMMPEPERHERSAKRRAFEATIERVDRKALVQILAAYE